MATSLQVSANEEIDHNSETIELAEAKKIPGNSRDLLKFMLAFKCINVSSATKKRSDTLNVFLVDPNGQAENWIQQQQQAIDCARRGGNRLLSIWTIFSPYLYTYLSLKPLVTFILRFSINSKQTRTLESGETESVSWLAYLLELYGDPSCSVADLSPLVYLGTPVSGILFNCAIPYYFGKIRSFSSSLASFLLDPKREIQRIDRSVLEKLDFAIEEVESRRKELSKQLQRRFRVQDEHPIIQRHQRSRLIGDLTRLMDQTSSLRYFRRNLHTIRPEALKPDWLHYCSRSFWVLCVGVYIVNLSFMCICELFIDFTFVHGRCEIELARQRTQQLDYQPLILLNQSHPAGCRFAQLFSVAELILLVEMHLLINVFVLSSISLFISLHFMQIRHQLHLTEKTSDRLAGLLFELRKTGQQLSNERGQKESEHSLTRLDRLMYANIIGLWTFDEESRRNVTFIARITSFFIVFVFALTLATFGMFNSAVSAKSVQCSIDRSDRPGSRNEHQDARAIEIAVAIWSVHWLYTNAMLMHCASIPARVVRMKQLVSSVVAQTVSITERQRLNELAELELRTAIELTPELRVIGLVNSPIALLWRRIVLTHNFINEHHSVNVFDLKLTYRKTLELNFYVAALIVLLSTKYI